MAWQDGFKKGLWWVGANFCGSTRCQAKLNALKQPEEQGLLQGQGASAPGAEAQEGPEVNDRKKYLQEVGKELQIALASSLFMVPLTTIPYVVQNRGPVPAGGHARINWGRAINSSMINSALNGAEIGPAILRVANYFKANAKDSHALHRGILAVVSFYSALAATAPFFEGTRCAYRDLGWSDGASLQGLNYLTSALVVLLYMPALFDKLAGWTKLNTKALNPKQKELDKALNVFRGDVEELQRFGVKVEDIESVVAEIAERLKEDNLQEYVKKPETLNKILAKQRFSTDNKYLEGARKGVWCVMKTAFILPPWVAQSLSVYNFFNSMPWHGYGVLLPLAGPMHLPYVGFTFAMVANTSLVTFDNKLADQGANSLVRDLLNAFRNASCTYNVMQGLGWILAQISTYESTAVFSGQSSCGAGLTTHDQVPHAVGDFLNKKGVGDYVTWGSVVDAFFANEQAIVGLMLPVVVGVGTLLLSRCTRGWSQHTQLTKAKEALAFKCWQVKDRAASWFSAESPEKN